MIDFHNHVVPAVDDGAKSMEIAIEMLKTAVSQGVTEVMATPLREHPKFEMLQVTDQMILDSYKNLCDEVEKQQIPVKLHLGAEVYFQQGVLPGRRSHADPAGPADAGPGHHGLRHRGTETGVPAEDPVRRTVLVPGLLRTGRRLRPGQPETESRIGRR